jgi:hypothetical protein
VSATHNHHGPDTAFDVNHSWYEHMSDQVAAAVVAALKARQPARLRVAAGQHWFGMNDSTDPQIFDPRLNVLQAVDTSGKVIATVVQWNNPSRGHARLLTAPVGDLRRLRRARLVGGDCSAEGRYFTSDYAGVLRQDLIARYGGEAALPERCARRADRSRRRAGLGGHGPSTRSETSSWRRGCAGRGGGSDYTARATSGARRSSASSLRSRPDACSTPRRPISDSRISYAVQPFFTRLSNLGFRILLVVDPSTGFTQLGHNVAPLYNCQTGVPPTTATCTPDGGASADDPLLGLPFRVGDHLRSAVEYVRIGPIGMMFLPGEIPGELTAGLPAGFRSTPQNWYEEPLGLHAFGADYTIPGYTTRPHVRRVSLDDRARQRRARVLHPDLQLPRAVCGRRVHRTRRVRRRSTTPARSSSRTPSRARPARRSPTIHRCSRTIPSRRARRSPRAAATDRR